MTCTDQTRATHIFPVSSQQDSLAEPQAHIRMRSIITQCDIINTIDPYITDRQGRSSLGVLLTSFTHCNRFQYSSSYVVAAPDLEISAVFTKYNASIRVETAIDLV